VIDRDAEGVSATKLKKLGWHASDTAELSFDNVKVPAENLIGKEGQGFYYLMGGLQLERLSGAIGAYAACEGALNYALEYMAQRTAFGRPINRFQVLRHRIAQLASEIEACKQFVLHCCRVHNDGQYAVKECSMAKLLATELSDKVMYQCLQFFGGYGFMEEFKIARMFRDSRVGTIGGGSSEIMREIIAKMVIDDVDYKSNSQTRTQTRTQTQTQTQTKSQSQVKNQVHPPKEALSLPDLISKFQSRATETKSLGKSLKFDFGDQQLFIDGSGDHNQFSADNKTADCTVNVSFEDFQKLLSGQLNPMNAMMGGQLEISGDMSVAMKLQSLFK
jgi:putative sterol carrier protein